MRVGTIAYATHQGLGYLVKSFFDAGVIDQVLLVRHTSRPTHAEWYGDRATAVPCSVATLEKWLDGIDVFLCFETPFDWSIVDRCKQRGIKTVCMPMYEWYPREKMGAFDLYLCPSELDHEYFGGKLFPPPVDPETWKERTKAIRFLHNAGNVGYLENKGTRELLEAMLYVQSDATLTVRCQDQDTFAKIVEQIPDVAECNKIDWALGEIDYEDLFAEHDVYVAPERFNGLSMPLREAYAAGMMVMTTDRFPHNAWLPVEPLIPVSHYRRACIAQRLLPFRFAVVDPHKIAECVDAWHGRDIAEFSHRGREWAEANSWNVKKPILLDLLENA